MKPTRLLQRILVLGETSFVGSALVTQLLNENQELEIWVTESNVFDNVQDSLKHRIHLLKISTKKNLIDIWKTYSWEAILHLVSNYKENNLEYKAELYNRRSLVGGSILEIVQSTHLKPLYVEIANDWVFDGVIWRVEEEAEETNILYLENYVNRIGVETTNILSISMQSNHWIFSFIKSLENRTSFGVPCNAMELRDWIALEDYIEAIDVILKKGRIGQNYNIVGFNEWTNYDLMLLIGATYDKLETRDNGSFKFQMSNEKIRCRQSYEEIKIGLSYLELNAKYTPCIIYDIIDDLIEISVPLITKS